MLLLPRMEETYEVRRHLQTQGSGEECGDTKGHVPSRGPGRMSGQEGHWRGGPAKYIKNTHAFPQSDSCFLEVVLLLLKCFMFCEAFASWNRLLAPVFLFTQIPSLIELITPL